jgi:hypothetical protein
VLLGNRRHLGGEGIDPTPAEDVMVRSSPRERPREAVAINGGLAGVIDLVDTLKPEAKNASSPLRGSSPSGSDELEQSRQSVADRSRGDRNMKRRSVAAMFGVCALLAAPVCIGVHAVFAGGAFADLIGAGAARV